MERNLSSNNCFEEASSTLTSFDFGSDDPDLEQCINSLARLSLREDFQEVPQLKSYPDRGWRECPCDEADGVKSPNISSFRENGNKWHSKEELEEQDEISVQENRRGKHDDRLENALEKDKNRGISIPQNILEAHNVVCNERNDAFRASFHGRNVIADSGENSKVLATNGACGFDKEENIQVAALLKTRDSYKNNSKAKRPLGLKGGRQSNFSSGLGSQKDPNEENLGTNHIGMDPCFLARHSYEYNAFDEHWNVRGAYEGLKVPSNIHSVYGGSGYVPEVHYPAPPSSSAYPGCPDVTEFTAGDHSAFISTMGSPQQAHLNPDGYQLKEPFLMPKAVPAKTLKLRQSSGFLEDGSKAKPKSKSEANLPLIIREFPNGDVPARYPPNNLMDGHVLTERPTFSSQFERRDDTPIFFPDEESAVTGLGLLNSNLNTSTDESLAVLERRVAEACSLVERTLKAEKQEREKTMKETEKRRKEEWARKEQQARERKEGEARERRETECRYERVEGNATSGGRETPSQNSAGDEVRQWQCEHYQRLCRVKDKNRGRAISISEKILETTNVVCDGRNDTPKASFQRGDEVADSGENPDVLATDEGCGIDDKYWDTQGIAPPKPQGDLHKSNSKRKISLCLKDKSRSSTPETFPNLVPMPQTNLDGSEENLPLTVREVPTDDVLARIPPVKRKLKEREERRKKIRETEPNRKENRTSMKKQTRERKKRPKAKEGRETDRATSDGGETLLPNPASADDRQWLCEHYQRFCRVKFPCCGKFFPCQLCHNNSGCPNDNSKAREACYVECSVCSYQQEINQDAHTCARCKTRFSAYFCSVCKHFTGEDKTPYHCTKCGICRINKDSSFHCGVCNICMDKQLEGRHPCRPNSEHDDCCICLEDAFNGCQILPCSHKVHRECAIAMIQNGVRNCPICRHPLYGQLQQ